MKNLKEMNETKKPIRGSAPMRVLSADQLRHAAGGDGDSGTKRPIEE